MSICPKASNVCLTRCATPASSVTEAPFAIAVPPAAVISATTFCAASDDPPAADRATQIVHHHFAPRREPSAWQRPVPPPAPVTIATSR
jgi:hypothetical protein